MQRTTFPRRYYKQSRVLLHVGRAVACWTLDSTGQFSSLHALVICICYLPFTYSYETTFSIFTSVFCDYGYYKHWFLFL